MADIMSAAARRALPATPSLVDHHRAPFHDQFCRCRACKPPLDRSRDMRRRAWVVGAVLLGTFWGTVAWAALS